MPKTTGDKIYKNTKTELDNLPKLFPNHKVQKNSVNEVINKCVTPVIKCAEVINWEKNFNIIHNKTLSKNSKVILESNAGFTYCNGSLGAVKTNTFLITKVAKTNVHNVAKYRFEENKKFFFI